MAAHRPLEPWILVRVQVPRPFAIMTNVDESALTLNFVPPNGGTHFGR